MFTFVEFPSVSTMLWSPWAVFLVFFTKVTVINVVIGVFLADVQDLK